MTFTIPHPADAIEDPADTFPQSQWDRKDIEIIVAGFSNVGVVSGCAVTAQASPNMSVAVALGTVMVGGTTTDDLVSVSSGNVTVTTAHATLPRFDLVVVSDAGAKSVVAGTAAATPVFPAIPASRVVLASVYVPAADTAVNTAQIVDKRMPLPSPPEPSAAQWTTVSKPSDTPNATTTLAADPVIMFPMLANTKYRFRAGLWLRCTGGVSPSGFKWRLLGPASPTLMLWTYNTSRLSGAGSNVDEGSTSLRAFSTADISGQTNDTGWDRHYQLTGYIHNGANAGDVTVQFAAHTSGGETAYLKAGSWVEYGVA